MDNPNTKEIIERIKNNQNFKGCQGEGMCLRQTNWDWIYMREQCKYNCTPVKCPNYIVCGEVAPLNIMWCHDSRCLYCNKGFGKNLSIKNQKQECPVCLEEKEIYVQMSNCTHYICLVCFRRLHYICLSPLKNFKSEDNITFPEPQVVLSEEELPEEPEYNSDEDESEDEDEHKKLDEFLKTCPLCREKTIPPWRKRMEESKS